MTNVADRVNYLIQEYGYSDNAFMKVTGINNLGKKKKGLVGYTDSDIIRISNSLNISYTWLKNGCGELNNNTDEDKVISDSIRRTRQTPWSRTHGTNPKTVDNRYI